MKISCDTADILFRGLFCLIFLGLGGEHLFQDDLIQHLMPYWIPWKRTASIFCGLWLCLWGTFILLGYKLRLASYGLGAFLLVVTAGVHLPGIFFYPPELSSEQYWMWDILQRSNLVKNLCLLGVCFQLLHHEVGKYSLEGFFSKSEK